MSIKTDMDLLAFNAGIPSANVCHDLPVATRAVQVQTQSDALQALPNALIVKTKTLLSAQALASPT